MDKLFSTDNATKEAWESTGPDKKIADMANLASHEDVLSELDHDLRLQGFAGDTTVPRLVYLCLTTRYFERPVSLVIKGPSGSGKSFALNSALEFIPNDAYESFSGMSEKALVYSGLDLKHRYLVIQEAAGLASGNGRAFLRQLISEGEVRFQTVVQSKDGPTGKELPQIEGPAGLIMTTTANGLHLEDESRMLSFHMDESPERIREALLAGVSKSAHKEEINFRRWHDFHEWLGVETNGASVDVPFQEALVGMLPLTHFRVLRDFPQIISLIKAHALLHRLNRDKDESGRIVATLRDYGAVRDLVENSLAQGLEVTVPPRIREVVNAVRELTGEEAGMQHSFGFREGVSLRRIAEHIGRERSVVSRNAKDAFFYDYLRNLSPGQGREAEIVLGERELPSGNVLPSCEELEREAYSR